MAAEVHPDLCAPAQRYLPENVDGSRQRMLDEIKIYRILWRALTFAGQERRDRDRLPRPEEKIAISVLTMGEYISRKI